MIYFLTPKLEKIEKPENEPVQWRISCYPVTISSEQTVLMVRAKLNKNFWILPGGGVELEESIPEAVARECYEETGYRIECTSARPLTFGETNFFDPIGKKFYHSINLIFPAKLVNDVQDKHVINTVEKDEIEEVKWVPLEDLTKDNCHFMMWPAIEQIKNAR